jgi:hypothetical protein
MALTLGCNQKWIAEQTGLYRGDSTDLRKYIRDSGDSLLRAYVETANTHRDEENLKAKP